MRADDFQLDDSFHPLNFDDSLHLGFGLAGTGFELTASQMKPERPTTSSSNSLLSLDPNSLSLFPPTSTCNTDGWDFNLPQSGGLPPSHFNDFLQQSDISCEESIYSPDLILHNVAAAMATDPPSLLPSPGSHYSHHASHQVTPISLSPLHFAHSRSHSTSPSPDFKRSLEILSGGGSTAGSIGVPTEDMQLTDGGTSQVTDGGSSQIMEKVPRHKKPAHKRAEVKRRYKIQA